MQQHGRGRLVQEVLTVLGVGAAIVVLVAAITALVYFLSGDRSGLHILANLVGIALLIAVGVVLATLGQAVLQDLLYGRTHARTGALNQVPEKTAALAAKNPDMALLLEILQETKESQ